jgi:predicted TIM-barrel fold metal-dependent hydrolase
MNTKVIDSNCTLEKGRTKRLLLEMDRHAIERAFIGPAKNFVAVDNRTGNAYISKAMRENPGRFIGYSVASPWHGKKAITELERARDLGLTGLRIDPAVQGFILTDPLVFPLIEFAERAGWPVFCTTGMPVYSMPFQLAELAEKYPRVKFIMGHGAFSDFWYDVPDALNRCPNIETSYILPSQISHWIKVAGIQKFVFGSDYPFSSLHLELKKISLLKADIDKRRILRKNIQSVLRRRR